MSAMNPYSADLLPELLRATAGRDPPVVLVILPAALVVNDAALEMGEVVRRGLRVHLLRLIRLDAEAGPGGPAAGAARRRAGGGAPP